MNSPLRAAIFVIVVLFWHTEAVFAADWSVPRDFATIQAAIDSPSVGAGDRILVGPGSFAGAAVTKQVHIQGVGRASITSGPVHPSGMIQGFRLFEQSDGTTISHLRFTVDLPVINASFNRVDNVTITQNTLVNPVQGISNWLGSSWEITQNTVSDLRTRCGGGIAILAGDYSGGTVSDNVVSHNHISGTVHVSPTDCGGYSATGIVVYADFRWGAPGSTAIAYNRIVKNTVSLTSDTPAVVDVVGIELSEAGDPDPATHVIHDNAVGFNDLRGTAIQLAITPDGLDSPTNDISRNLGENRGHGLHPSAFGPGGFID
jgi:hypothetical protein